MSALNRVVIDLEAKLKSLKDDTEWYYLKIRRLEQEILNLQDTINELKDFGK